MIVRICAETHPGLVRSNNEDAIGFDADAGIGIVADGMGGHNAGEIASGMAAAFVKSEMRQWLERAGRNIQAGDIEAALSHAIMQANQSIFTVAQGNRQYAGMGTTLVAGVFHRDTLVLAHIGDSRCYRWRAGQFTQITHDHSLHQEQADAGLLPEEGLLTRHANIVTRALGVEADKPQLAEIHRHDVLADDLYLMCSDGLTDMVDDAAIAAILAGAGTLQEKASQLIAAANNGGGRDNVSVLLAQVVAREGLLATAGRALRGIWGGK